MAAHDLFVLTDVDTKEGVDAAALWKSVAEGIGFVPPPQASKAKPLPSSESYRKAGLQGIKVKPATSVSIENAVKAAIEISQRLGGASVRFDFEGVSLEVFDDDHPA